MWTKAKRMVIYVIVQQASSVRGGLGQKTIFSIGRKRVQKVKRAVPLEVFSPLTGRSLQKILRA